MNCVRGRKRTWFADRITENEKHYHRIKRTLVEKQTRHQTLQILELFSFGKCLILDDDLQSAEYDEYIYHEALVHPAMALHGSPRRVLILGGGEGATLREVLKWRTVSKVVMVDVDPEVIKLSRKFLPSFSLGAFDDKRAEVMYEDARKYVSKTKEQFSVIISDLPSPIEGGPACLLYTKEFYQELKRIASKDGVFVLQCDSFSTTNLSVGARIGSTVKRVFEFVRPYATYVPSFDALWGFILASSFDVLKTVSREQIENRIKRNLGSKRLKFYDGTTHVGLFDLPKYLRKALSSRRRTITEKDPISIYK